MIADQFAQLLGTMTTVAVVRTWLAERGDSQAISFLLAPMRGAVHAGTLFTWQRSVS